MSRTYRSNPRAKFEYVSGATIDVARGPYLFTFPLFQRLSKGGWKEAKRLLSKEEYAEQRKLRGDKFTGYYQNAGVDWWYRNELEKKHRHHTRRELHRYFRNPDYEPMVCEEPSGDEWWYW